MLRESEKALIRKLALPCPAVAIRFRFEAPDAALAWRGAICYNPVTGRAIRPMTNRRTL